MTSIRFERMVIVLGALTSIGGAVATYTFSTAHAVTARTPAAAIASAPAATTQALPDFASIVVQHGPAVVNISVSGTRKTSGPQIDPNSPFYEFFRQFQGPQSETPVQGQGSGFIVSSDGVVLTNAHVVADAREVTVKLTDRREFTAKVVGIDKATDIAVLRIQANNLPTVKIGDSRRARVGEWVLAIGAPFGLENTVTAGIISAKSRALPSADGYVPFIQTDVAINPGNSGGPLFNLAGEVIGINSQIYSRSGGYQGLSFAIPIETAMRVEQQLVATGKVSRGRLGVAIQELNASLAESFGLDKVQGALVNSVEKGSPADKAGIKAGDVIRKLNGIEVTASSELPLIVSELKPGTQSNLEIWRDGRARNLTVTIGEFQTPVAAADKAPAQAGRLGLAVRPLTPEERKQTELKSGVVVEEVAGAAAKAGIEPGDVILRANGAEITNAESLRAQIAKSGKRVALLVQRGEQRMFVPVELG
ncbi:MAG: peptidase [Betaproteobacteria bacterium RIFCSPLOWO2_02_FULL_62_17]|nr:MAG: peptidase [Betaproteobacteria bacterium RIFCSPLOWO2_02_FULL_62_17]